MTHLGRFVLIETGGSTGEGYVLLRSNYHEITGSFEIFCAETGKIIGVAEVIRIGEKYYMDAYDILLSDPLSYRIALGRKNFTTRGIAIQSDRNRVSSYKMKSIILETSKNNSNFQVDRYPVVLKPDLNSSAFLSNNWFNTNPDFHN